VVLARECVALLAWLLVVAEEVVQGIVLVLERPSFDVSTVSSLFHGSAPGVRKWIRWLAVPWTTNANPQ
jgi:hypothetical protein